MRSSARLRQYIKNKEKLTFRAYADPKTGGAPWTNGWGHTGPEVTPNSTCTEEQAEQWFDDDIAEAERLVMHYATAQLTQGQFDALVSIFYNIGPGGPRRDGIGRLKDGRPSTLLRKLNAGDYDGARAEFFKWISPGSSVERGLRIRRTEEVKNFWDIV